MHVDCSGRSLKCNDSFDWCAECSVGEEFACKDGSCILQGWECDTEPDCPDKSDEDPTLCGQLSNFLFIS